MEPFRYFRNIAFSNINEFYDIFFNKTLKLKNKNYQIEKKISRGKIFNRVPILLI